MQHRSHLALTAGVALLGALSLAAPPAHGQSQNMTLVGHLDSYAGYASCWGYTAPDGTELAIIGTDTGASIIDATNPASPFEVLFVPGPSSIWREMKTYSHYAYIVTEGAGGGLKIVDLNNPHSPVLVTTYLGAFTTCHSIWIDTVNARAYCNGTNNGLRILSLANPVAPTLVATWNTWYVHDCYVRNGRCYGGAIFDGFMGILDVSSLPAITELGRVTTPSAACHNTWLSNDSKYCFTTDETGGGHIGVYDVQNPAAPVLKAQYFHPTDPGSSVHNVTVLGDLMPTAWYVNGVEMIDVSNPLVPERVGYYDTFPGAGTYDGVWGVYPYTQNGTIYASDMVTGLYILRFTPNYGILQGTLTNAVTSSPINQATIRVPAASKVTTSDALGFYRFRLNPGTYNVIYERFGYASDTLSVTLPDTSHVIRDLAMAPLPAGSLSGIVRVFPGGAPLQDVVLAFQGSPDFTQTSAGGSYSFASVPAGHQTLAASKFGYVSTTGSVYVQVGQPATANFSMRVALFADDVEINRGWALGATGDDATTGLWTRVNPNGTGAGLVQPEDDHTPDPGTFCFVTGNGPPGGSTVGADVDGGKTTLVSPTFNLSGMVKPLLHLYRWYSNDSGPAPGEDTLKIDVSNNGGTSWVALERLTTTRNFWEEKSFVLSDFVAPTANVKVRVVASDYGLASTVEAAVDDIEIYESATTTTVAAPVDAPRARLALAGSPNPFPSETALRFTLPATMPVLLDVYDVEGRRVRRVHDGILEAGPYAMNWDGRDDDGHRVAAGIYMARLLTPSQGVSDKLIFAP